MKQQVLLLFALFCSTVAFAQNEISATIDFEGDGIPDRAVILKDDAGYRLQYSLSSLKGKAQITPVLDYLDAVYSLQTSKNVLILQAATRSSVLDFKFRYDKKLNEIILIGCDQSEHGNAVEDGSGTSSYNLLTGGYEAEWFYYDDPKRDLSPYPKVRKKLPVKRYTLKEFSGEVIESLHDLDYKFFPPNASPRQH